MTPSELLDGIQEVAHQHLDFAGALQPDQPLVEVLRLDSVRMLTLVAEIENRFQVCLEEGDEADLLTVGDLVALLQRRLPS